MAIAFQTKSELAPTTNGTEALVPAPSGIAVDDFLLVFIAQNHDRLPITAPAGWVSIIQNDHSGNAVALSIWYKIAVSADTSAANYSFTWTTSDLYCAMMLRFDGTATSGDIIAASAENEGTSDTATCPTVTTTDANSLVVRACAFDSGSDAETTVDTITDYTQRDGGGDGFTSDGTGGAECLGSAQDIIQAGIAATGTADITGFGTTEQWCSATFAVNPSVAGGGFVPYPRPRGLDGGGLVLSGGLQ